MPTSPSQFSLPGLAVLRSTGRLRRCASSIILCAVGIGGPARAAPATAEEQGFSAVLAGAPIRIELLPSVEVRQQQVALRDVARVSGGDLPTTGRLMALPLGQAPRAVEVLRLDRDRLRRWIRARTGLEAPQIEWAGSSTSEIRLAVQKLSAQVIAEKAAEELRAGLSKDGMRVEVSIAESPRSLTVPAGRVALSVRPIEQGTVVAKRLSVWVDVSVDGQFVRTVPVNVSVRVFGLAYVAAADHASGETLDPSLWLVREVEWSGRQALPAEPGTMVGLRLRRPVAAGDVLTRAQVEVAPLVSRGGWATLRAAQGLVELESRVEVLQDGRPGQYVRVKLANASSAVLARVTGPGTLEVRP